MSDRALLVGINAYPGQPLNGCINDISDMARFLVTNCGFSADSIRLLADARATTSGIIDRLGWLLTGVKPGDRIFFHYSGHGALFPMRNPQGQVTAELDTICPVDFDWSRQHAILSTDFQRMFSSVPAGTDFVFVSDSCNSGDLLRGIRPYSPKFLVPPADIAWRSVTARSLAIKRQTIQAAVHDNCAFLSGCASDQESADAVFSGRPNGALTYYLLKVLATASRNLALSKVLLAVRQELSTNRYTQLPQLRGPDSLTTLPFFLGGGSLTEEQPKQKKRRMKR